MHHLSLVMRHLSHITCHLITTLCSFSCHECPRMLGDAAEGDLVIDRLKTINSNNKNCQFKKKTNWCQKKVLKSCILTNVLNICWIVLFVYSMYTTSKLKFLTVQESQRLECLVVEILGGGSVINGAYPE